MYCIKKSSYNVLGVTSPVTVNSFTTSFNSVPKETKARPTGFKNYQSGKIMFCVYFL